MKAQFYADRAGALAMRWGEPLRIDRLAGELTVWRGRVWLTQRGDGDDHVLEAGERIVLDRADAVIVEPWQRGESALLHWQPCAQPRPLAVRAWRGLAFLAGAAARVLRRPELGFDALARKAASMARRAQGCICAGDSIASAGTVQ